MFKITRLIALLAFFFIFSNSHAQDKTIDSLKIVLRNPKIHDTIKLYSMVLIKEQQYTDIDPKSFYINHMVGDYVMKCLKKDSNAELHKIFIQYLANYYASLMVEYQEKKDVTKALAAIDKSIALFKSEKLYDDMYYSIVTKGTFYAKINEHEKAISYLFAGLRYFEKHPKKYTSDGIATVYSHLAAIYSSQGKQKESIEYNKKNIAFLNAITPSYPNNEYAKCIAYSNCGTSYLEIKKYDDAFYNFNKALQISRKLEDSFTTSFLLSRIGTIKMALKKYDEAEVFLKESLKGDLDEESLANGYINIAELYFIKKDYAQARLYVTKGLDISKKIKSQGLQEMACEILFNVSYFQKDYKTALHMHQVYDKLVDKTKISASKNALEQQQLKYDFEKKELKTKLVNQKEAAAKNNWLIGLSGLLLLLLLGVYFYYRNNKQKQAITVLEKDQIKQKLLVSQMNPHFIFNSIENIQQLIYDKKDKDAVNYLDKFSVLTRQILENSNENYISLSEEVAMIGNYLAIQQLLYSNKFDFTVTVEETIEPETIFLPPMLTQPFIENAIKHGLASKDENGMVDIRFYLNEGRLFFEVLDNGKGFDTSKRTDNHKSLAMVITKERLVNYTKNQDFVVQADNIKDKDEKVVGAKIVFEIPYIYEN
jgi:tetratricopeptide (TPR) repeat protein